jgi:NAD(P)-dependent dehydrogenase (short-subunit alcohol dehydrogenase family)
MLLKGKVVVVTGAAGRIGAAVARAVVGQGGGVVLVDLDQGGISRLEEELGVSQALAVPADACSAEGADHALAEGNRHFGRMDGAVHSAYPRSAGWGAPYEALTGEFLCEDLSKQLGGTMIFAQRVLEYFKDNGGGNLVHIASIQGVRAPRFEHYEGTSMVSPAEYSVIKAAVIHLTQYLAKYYMGKNIQINCVSPGGIIDAQPTEFLNKYRQSCNRKGMLDGEDVAGPVLFLLSDLAAYVTGQNILVDDGWSL